MTLAFAFNSFQSLWSVSKVGLPLMGVGLDRSKRVYLWLIFFVMVDDGVDQLSIYVVVSCIKSI